MSKFFRKIVTLGIVVIMLPIVGLLFGCNIPICTDCRNEPCICAEIEFTEYKENAISQLQEFTKNLGQENYCRKLGDKIGHCLGHQISNKYVNK